MMSTMHWADILQVGIRLVAPSTHPHDEHLCCKSMVDICEDEDGDRSVFKIPREINRRQTCLTCLDKFFSISLRGFLVTNEMVSEWLEQAFYLDSFEGLQQLFLFQAHPNCNAIFHFSQ